MRSSAWRGLLVIACLALLGSACSSGATSERHTPSRSPAAVPTQTPGSDPTSTPTPETSPNPPGFSSSIAPLSGEILREVRNKNW
ncbi:MAG TPA: hypothetical protein VGJ67_00240, partial [Actinomycetota bacterium]